MKKAVNNIFKKEVKHQKLLKMHQIKVENEEEKDHDGNISFSEYFNDEPELVDKKSEKNPYENNNLIVPPIQIFKDPR